MHVELYLPAIWSFLAVLARVVGFFSFLPVPGLKSPLDPPRAVLAVLFTLCLAPKWPPAPPSSHLTGTSLVVVLVQEAAFGVCAGLIVQVLLDAFQFAAQMLSQMAGFSYASTIDPTNDTDSGDLLILCQLLCGWLAISLGIDRELVAIFARSFDSVPPGAFRLSLETAEPVIRLGSSIFETGLRLSLPVMGVFLALDILLGVLSRLEQQLQLTTILFPAKSAGAILATVALVGSFPKAFAQLARVCLDLLRGLAER